MREKGWWIRIRRKKRGRKKNRGRRMRERKKRSWKIR